MASSTPADADENLCTYCEGYGELAKNFGLNSQGRPQVVECPHCRGTGLAIPLSKIH
jgi:DnaJ-class molecular chaperone